LIKGAKKLLYLGNCQFSHKCYILGSAVTSRRRWKSLLVMCSVSCICIYLLKNKIWVDFWKAFYCFQIAIILDATYLNTGWSKSLYAPDDYNTESYMSFLPHYLAQSDCLAADRQAQGDTSLTLTPTIIRNSNYVNMVSDWNCLKYFRVSCTVIFRSTENFAHLYDTWCKLFLPTTAAIPTGNFWFNLRHKQEWWGEETRITIDVGPSVFQLLAMCGIWYSKVCRLSERKE
jgi:hypothetical protein